MQTVRRVGYEIKAVSNLMRRKIWEYSCGEEHDRCTEMERMMLGFLCRNAEQEIFQKDLERVFYIRRSTASRLLKTMEEEGLIQRRPVQRDARLKQVMPTPRAMALHQEILNRIDAVEAVLTQGLTQEEISQFMSTMDKLKRNLAEEGPMSAALQRNQVTSKEETL